MEKKSKLFELLDYSIMDDEVSVFQYNSRNNTGIFSIANIDNGDESRQVVYHNISKKEFVSKIDEIAKKYEKINI